MQQRRFCLERRCGGSAGQLLRRDDRGFFDVVEFGEFGFEVFVALFLDERLVGGLAVFGINFLDDIHAFDNFTEGSEAEVIESLIVFEIDEQLAGASIGAAGGECDEAFEVGFRDFVVFDFAIFPFGVDGGVAVHAPLDDEARDHAEEAAFVVEAGFDQFVESIRAIGRPLALDFDGEVATGRFETDAEGFRGCGGFGFVLSDRGAGDDSSSEDCEEQLFHGSCRA